MSASALAAAAVLAGCEPSPGRVLDVRNVRAGDFELQLQLRAEGDWGNPSNGQHFELFCRNRAAADSDSESRWTHIGHGYTAESKLHSAPVQRIATDSSGFFLTDVLGGAWFSFGSCVNHRVWGGRLPHKYAELYTHGTAPGYVREVHFCVSGPQLSFQIEPAVFVDHRIVWVTSQDAGKSWQVSEGSAPALACERESEQGLVLGSH